MCKATLLPDPDSPLTRMSLMSWRLYPRSSGLPAYFPAVGPAGVRGVLVCLLFLVLEDAAVELVGQQVDRGVHVFLGGIGMDGIAAHVQRGFGLLSEFLHGKDAMHVDDVVEVARDPLQLLLDVAAHRRGDFDMMTGKRQLHDASPFLAYLLSLKSCLVYRAAAFALRSLDGASPRASRYLATVRRATAMPSPDRSSAM